MLLGLCPTLIWANPQPLAGKIIREIEIQGLANAEEENNAHVFLRLHSILNEEIAPAAGESEALSADYAHYLLDLGKKEIALSQQPFSYYHAQVNWEVKALDENNAVKVIYQVQQGEPVRIRNIDVAVQGEALQDAPFAQLLAEQPFQKNAPLLHQEYELYKAKLNNLAEERGYFERHFLAHQIRVNTEVNWADIELKMDSAQRYRYGDIQFTAKEGSIPLNESLLRRYVNFHPGQHYHADDLGQLQQDLQASQYFSEVIVSGSPDKDTQTVPVQALLSMNKNKHYLYGLGYSTDQGIRGKFEFERRWMNRHGHQWQTQLYASQKQSGLEALYRLPGRHPQTDSYFLRGVGEIKNHHYKSKQAILEGGYIQKRGYWLQRYSLLGRYDRFRIGLDEGSSRLFYPRAQLTYTRADSPLTPERGFQLRLEALATLPGLSNVRLLQLNADLRHVYTWNQRHRLIARLGAGSSWSNDFHRLPANLRYFSGGDRSVRGYVYESLGGRDAQGHNIGGRHRYEAGLEYEYYFMKDWALAAFVDVGDAWIQRSKPKWGAGLGIHWRSPVGPIKLDFARGFDRELGKKFYMHLNIGAELDL